MLEYSDSGVNIAGSNLQSRILLIVCLTELGKSVQQLEELIFGTMKTLILNI